MSFKFLSGMEARYNCCKAIEKALTSSGNVIGDGARDAIAKKVSSKTIDSFLLLS